MRISDWSSDVCSSDLMIAPVTHTIAAHSESDIDRQWFRGIAPAIEGWTGLYGGSDDGRSVGRLERHLPVFDLKRPERSEEHTSELQSLMRISYAVFCLKKQKQYERYRSQHTQHTIQSPQ